MATDQAAAEAKGKAKKGMSRSTLLIVVLLVVIVGGGIYFFLGRGDSTSAGAEKEEVHLGVVVTLEPIFINLKEDRFLKLGVATVVTVAVDQISTGLWRWTRQSRSLATRKCKC